MREMLPAINTRNRHRITATDYAKRIQTQPHHVMYINDFDRNQFRDHQEDQSSRNRRTNQQERSRRFALGATALATATAAAALGAYNSIQIEFLRTQITEVI